MNILTIFRKALGFFLTLVLILPLLIIQVVAGSCLYVTVIIAKGLVWLLE